MVCGVVPSCVGFSVGTSVRTERTVEGLRPAWPFSSSDAFLCGSLVSILNIGLGSINPRSVIQLPFS